MQHTGQVTVCDLTKYVFVTGGSKWPRWIKVQPKMKRIEKECSTHRYTYVHTKTKLERIDEAHDLVPSVTFFI